VRIWRPTIAFSSPGACAATVWTTASPKASRFAASFQEADFSLYGAYCATIDITCFPPGASAVSVIDGIVTSQ
jgi:hypothetical protein